jgi:hypothetical protein
MSLRTGRDVDIRRQSKVVKQSTIISKNSRRAFPKRCGSAGEEERYSD